MSSSNSSTLPTTTPASAPTSTHEPTEKILFNAISINNNIIQQRHTVYQPLLTPIYVIAAFLLIGIAFIPVGVGILLASSSVTTVSQRYDQLAPQGCVFDQPATCNNIITIPITETLSSPVYFYYQLDNYYQNHRRYEQSKSDAQYAGVLSSVSISDCNPLANYEGHEVYPCGLTANTEFNDTFAASYTPSGSTQPIALGSPQSDVDSPTWQKDGIAWQSDIHTKFVELSPQQIQSQNYIQQGPNTPAGQTLPQVTDQDWIVWMRISAFPTFKKLYRIINKDIPAGSVMSINVTNIYPVHMFKRPQNYRLIHH